MEGGRGGGGGVNGGLLNMGLFIVYIDGYCIGGILCMDVEVWLGCFRWYGKVVWCILVVGICKGLFCIGWGLDNIFDFGSLFLE